MEGCDGFHSCGSGYGQVAVNEHVDSKKCGEFLD